MNCECENLKNGQVMIIRVDSSVPEILQIPKEDTLKFFQNIVGGYIEPMSFTCKGKIMTSIVNEEGLINGLPYNELASHYVNTSVVGDVAIINPKDLT
jgi:hypothetical protein|tara:strand:+ start:2843 stop:3136 length:294 start_codon:yes stop_codon:yes gene_type:complete